MTNDGEGVVEEPIPESIRATGRSPKGMLWVSSSYLFMFSVSFYIIAALGYHLEPSTVISALAKNNITTVELVLRAYPQSFSSTNSYAEFFYYSQLPNTALARMKEIMNNPNNVSIAPIDVVEEVSVG